MSKTPHVYTLQPGKFETSDTSVAAFLIAMGIPYDGGSFDHEGRFHFDFVPPKYMQAIMEAWHAPEIPGNGLSIAKVRMVLSIRKNLVKMVKKESEKMTPAVVEFLKSERIHKTHAGAASFAKLLP